MHVVNVEPMVNRRVVRLVESLIADAKSGKLRAIFFGYKRGKFLKEAI